MLTQDIGDFENVILLLKLSKYAVENVGRHVIFKKAHPIEMFFLKILFCHLSIPHSLHKC